MGIRHELKRLRSAQPGRRFEDGYERTKVESQVLRISLIVLGFALMAVAAVTFWVPGPNFVLVLAGLALVGGQSRTVARLLDRGEVAGRRWSDERWKPYPHKRRVLVIVWSMVVVGLTAAAWAAFRQGWLPDWLPRA